MRRGRGGRVAAGLLALPILAFGLAGCGAGGEISLPTITIPTTIPSFTIPTIPVSTPPSTSAATRTEATGTVTVTRTETPRTNTVTSTVTAAPQPTPASGSGVPPWVWVVLAVLVLLLLALVIWLVRRARARSAWDQKMGVARRNALWVEDALVQQVMARASTAEAASTWQAAQPRLLSLDESLYALSTTAPDPERAAQAEQLRARLGGLVDAMGADTSTGRDATVDDLRARRSAVWRARTDLRTWLDAENARR
ncbi:MAG: hypothetical protein ABJA89_05135 [Lapillicoccus sp.]